MFESVENSRGIPKLSYKKAAVRLFLLGVTNQQSFRNLKKEGKRPADIPAAPNVYYPEFQSWQEMIELGEKLAKDIDESELTCMLSYSQLQALIRERRITTKHRYDLERKVGLLQGAPADPSLYSEFKSWEDFLLSNKKFLSYEDAKQLISQYGLTTSTEWRKFCRSGARPLNIPALPDQYYDKDFVSWVDFLSAEARLEK